MIRAASGAITGFRHDVMLTTADTVEGRQVARVIGLVRGNAVRARHVGHDIMAALRNLAGGEIREYTKLLGESREQAVDRMVEQAVGQGANAVVGVRFTTSMVMGGAAELLAYGTAVVLADPAEDAS
ncbi:MAG: YbjQ family protein [Deltaproteobacteria bacterium]|jgi:uncharacterized protein YbjQ (UPF0145 family)|nr:YbjQ family protein [Deltaproteobacteria bacterium]MBW2536249.1 YbjQ family protein [Deltaproteobacteria bacterium]